MQNMKSILALVLLVMLHQSPIQAQTYSSKYEKPLSTVMNGLEKRFKVKFKYNVDTTGLKLTYADFRARAYSLEESLRNILAQFDFNYWKQ